MGRMIDTDDLMQYAFGNCKGLIHTADIDKVPTAMEMLHGTLHITVDHDISDVYRVWLSQKGTHYGELYYPDYTDEEIQKMQDLEQAQFDKMYELGKQAAQEDLQPTCNQLATDTNSRQAAIKAIHKAYDDLLEDETRKYEMTKPRFIIKQAAQPEPYKEKDNERA